MQVEADFSTFFGSSERSKGAEFLRKEMVVISSASDTDVRALIKGSSPCRITLTADGVNASSFTSSCTCPAGRKGQLCKHVWGVLLKLEEDGADFLVGKIEVLPSSQKSSPSSQTRAAKQEEFKTQQKQRLKLRNQEIRDRKKLEKRGPRFTYPPHVQESLDFFSANGFALDALDHEALQFARRSLSRVFHPDKGGSHDEVIELNAHFEVLEDYLNG
jgi:hypothetical protein